MVGGCMQAQALLVALQGQAMSDRAALPPLPPQRCVTLLDGTQVASDDARWRAECLANWRHAQNVLAMPGVSMRAQRAQYVRDVGLIEGPVARARLESLLQTMWQQRAQGKAAAAAAAEGAAPGGAAL